MNRNDYGELQLGSGMSYHVCGFFPAVRLALVSLFNGSGSEDPAARWMAHRTRAILLIKALHWNRGAIEEHIAELQLAITEMPLQEHLHAMLGDKQLKAGNFDHALEAFSKVLTMPHVEKDELARAHYNIACVHARRNEVNHCQQSLANSAALKPIDRKWLAQDPDFESLRSSEWFRLLIDHVE